MRRVDRRGVGIFEHAGDRTIGENLVYRLAQNRGDRQHRELGESVIFGDRQSVGDDNLGDPRILKPLGRRFTQDAVGGGHDDICRAIVESRLGRFHDGATGVDHVVNDDANPTLNIPNDLENPYLIWHIGVAPLMDDR